METLPQSGDLVVRHELSAQIADRLRADILSGRLPAGSRLVQDQLCGRFGTSRIPIRDALRQLTHEGLLEEVRGQRVVASVGTEELADAEALVGVLHAWAARRVAETATEDELHELEAVHRGASGGGERERQLRATYEFHRWINHHARSSKLLQLLSLLERTTPRAFPVALAESDGGQTHADHAEILAALRARDAERVEQLMRQHTGRHLAELLRVVAVGQSQERGRNRPAS